MNSFNSDAISVEAERILNEAYAKAKRIEDESKEKYKVEMDKLKLISSRLSQFFTETINLYPSDNTRKIYATWELIKEILKTEETSTYSIKDKMQEMFDVLGDKKAQEGTNGFNIEDVLNPKEELDLMELCKELGVTD